MPVCRQTLLPKARNSYKQWGWFVQRLLVLRGWLQGLAVGPCPALQPSHIPQERATEPLGSGCSSSETLVDIDLMAKLRRNKKCILEMDRDIKVKILLSLSVGNLIFHPPQPPHILKHIFCCPPSQACLRVCMSTDQPGGW